MARHVDFDLHGIVGIRLVDADDQDAARVRRQLGPIEADLAREPDLVIRFVDELPISSPVTLIGLDDAGFTDDAFLVLRGPFKSRARVQLPLADIGGQAEILCEHGVRGIPLLLQLINLTALARGLLPMHASAFMHEGRGTLVTGWSKGGKTETLLAFMARGARYIGDEWVYLCPERGQMFGIPEPIRLWDWQLAQLPAFRREVGRARWSRLTLLRRLAKVLERVGGGGAGVATRAAALLARQCNVRLAPYRLFGRERCPLVGPLDRLLFAVSAEAPDVRIDPVSPNEVAERMLPSLAEERAGLETCYRKFRFAFPGMRNALLEQAGRRERDLLLAAFRDREAWQVSHPYPVSIESLFDVVRPALERDQPRRRGVGA